MTSTQKMHLEPAPPAAPEAVAASRAKVLVVDDDERNLLALTEVLNDVAEVVCASSGEEALRWLLRDKYAVIVLDVLMPGMDGYETAELVRAREQSRDTPIIFLTAINKEDAHLLKGYSHGAVDYVFKPFDTTIVRSKVSVFVSLHEKTLEIERQSAAQQRLLEDKVKAQQQRVEALEALRRAEERLELILSSLPIAVYVEEPAGNVRRFVSGDVKRITGYDATAFDAEPSLWWSRLEANETDITSLPASGSREYRWRDAKGATRIFFDQWTALSGSEGAIAGTIRDITEQRALQDQLVQAQKIDAVGKLTGGVAHDFNNLLASVMSGLALIERRAKLEPGTVEVLEMTRHAAEQGKQLVSRLLAFSRRQKLSPQRVNLTPLSKSLDSMLTPLLGGLVTLHWKLDPGLWETYIDPSQLELAIMNLVINSRDALPDGGIISISLENRRHGGSSELGAGEFVVLTVSDGGRGIPADVLPRVLEPFFTTKEAGRGTGLGLSMVYGFAHQSGGTLTIRSTEGKGTNVELWLPRAGNETEASTTPIGDHGIPRRDVPRRPMHVLLVDDSQTLRSLTTMQLEEAGFTISSAGSGIEAISIIGQDPDRFDVLLTDYAMPIMSGLELVAAVRQHRPEFPAVIVTGYAEVEAIKSRPDNVAVVTKPFTTAALVEALETSMRATA